MGRPPNASAQLNCQRTNKTRNNTSLSYGAFYIKKGLFRANLLHPKNTPTPKIVKNAVKTGKKQAKSPQKRTLKIFYFFTHTLDKRTTSLQHRLLFSPSPSHFSPPLPTTAGRLIHATHGSAGATQLHPYEWCRRVRCHPASPAPLLPAP